jgi:HEPN domain-containing protein
MPPERRPLSDPREWLNRARSSLAKARLRSGEIYLEDLCFDAQQAAEKAIKAVLIGRQLSFPRIHDLGRLLDLTGAAADQAPALVGEAVRLNRFAVASRYPGIAEPVTESEYAEAVAIAEAVVAWAEAMVEPKT